MTPEQAKQMMQRASESMRKLNPHLAGPTIEHSASMPGVEREADLHEQVIDECRRRGWQFLHGSMAERTHRTLGEPDFIVLADNGRVLFVECKSRTGKMTPEQAAFKHQADRNGHRVHVVRSFNEFLEIAN